MSNWYDGLTQIEIDLMKAIGGDGGAAMDTALEAGNLAKEAVRKVAPISKKFLKMESEIPVINMIVDVDIPYKAKNADTPLDIPTYPDGGQQPTHPRVVYFPEGWNGWRYWMTHTPFPNGQGNYENPHIVVSQDGKNWEDPAGITNPIFPQPARGFYSDVDLVYQPEEDRLYLFWRYVEASWTVENILVSYSTDGVNWSEKVTTLVDSKYMLSPAIVFDGETYHMWYAGSDDISKPVTGESITVRYRTSSSPFGPWSASVDTNLKGLYLRNNDVGTWHISVNKYGEEYHMLICSSNFDLYLATSTDKLNWKYNKMNPVLTRSGIGTGKFDSSKIYRASGLLVREGSGYRYKIWYGATGDTNNWTIGYTELLLGPSSMIVKPRHAKEQGLLVEGRTDQEATILTVNALKGASRAFAVTLAGTSDRMIYDIGKGLSLPNENDHVLLGSEAGIKGRFVTNAGVLYIQAGKTSADADAVVRVSRYLSNSNVKVFEVFADLGLYKGDVELDNATKGIILKSPDGSRWKVQIGNDGELIKTKL